jgi:hypothetical protein
MLGGELGLLQPAGSFWELFGLLQLVVMLGAQFELLQPVGRLGAQVRFLERRTLIWARFGLM